MGVTRSSARSGGQAKCFKASLQHGSDVRSARGVSRDETAEVVRTEAQSHGECEQVDHLFSLRREQMGAEDAAGTSLQHHLVRAITYMTQCYGSATHFARLTGRPQASIMRFSCTDPMIGGT